MDVPHSLRRAAERARAARIAEAEAVLLREKRVTDPLAAVIEIRASDGAWGRVVRVLAARGVSVPVMIGGEPRAWLVRRVDEWSVQIGGRAIVLDEETFFALWEG